MRSIFLCLLPLLLVVACTKPNANQYIESGRNKIGKSQFKEAIIDLDKAISLDPENAEAYFLRGNAKFNLRGNAKVNRKNMEDAIHDYSLSIALDPENPEVFYNRGYTLFILGDKDAACADWIMADALGKANIKDKIKGCNPITH